jgi:lipopolysaccharide export system protein LptC
LTGKVNVERAKGEGVNQLIINTSNVRVKPETSYAETDEWAELISPPNVTTGTGMKLVFSNPINIKLLANVRGKYETH